MSTTSELNELIAQQGAVVRQLKTDKSPDAPAAVQKLLDLKGQLAALGGGKKDDKKAVKFTLKTPKVSWLVSQAPAAFPSPNESN